MKLFPNKGKRWNEHEHIFLYKQRLVHDKTFSEIAKALGRTRASVQNRFYELRRQGEFTDEKYHQVNDDPVEVINDLDIEVIISGTKVKVHPGTIIKTKNMKVVITDDDY